MDTEVREAFDRIESMLNGVALDVRETRDLARKTDQTVQERVLPHIEGNGEPGLLSRVGVLEMKAARAEGAVLLLGVLCTVLTVVAGLLALTH